MAKRLSTKVLKNFEEELTKRVRKKLFDKDFIPELDMMSFIQDQIPLRLEKHTDKRLIKVVVDVYWKAIARYKYINPMGDKVTYEGVIPKDPFYEVNANYNGRLRTNIA